MLAEHETQKNQNMHLRHLFIIFHNYIKSVCIVDLPLAGIIS